MRDGDNWGETDNKKALDLLRDLLPGLALFGYVEVRPSGRRTSLGRAMATLSEPWVVTASVSRPRDVRLALDSFFKKERDG